MLDQQSISLTMRKVKAMTNYRIIFTENDVSLPDGACVGIMGEHNAVQLVITLPQSMVTGMSFHTVTINGVESALILADHANMDGAYRAENTVYFPLTASYTNKQYIDLYVTAYRQIDDEVPIIDKTVTARGLRFLPSKSNRGADGSLAAEIYQLKQKIYSCCEKMATKDWVRSLLGAFRKRSSGELLASADSGYISRDASGNLCVKIDGDITRINENNELEVFIA